MSHTTEQARDLWCPMARVAQAGNVDIPVAYNRSLSKQHKPMRSVNADSEKFQLGEDPEESTVLVLTATPGVSMAANCLGDKCAMWRWVAATEKSAAPTHGYCGLAGRSELMP